MSHAFSATENSQLQRAINLLIQSENLPVSEDVVDALAPAAVSSGFVASTGRFSELMRDAPILTLTAFLGYIGQIGSTPSFTITAVDPTVCDLGPECADVELTASVDVNGHPVLYYNQPFVVSQAHITRLQLQRLASDGVTWNIIVNGPPLDITQTVSLSHSYTDTTVTVTPLQSQSYRMIAFAGPTPAFIYNSVQASSCTDTAAPTGQITVPLNGATVSGTFPIIVNALDDCSLDHIDILLSDRGKYITVSSQKVFGPAGSVGYTLDTTLRPFSPQEILTAPVPIGPPSHKYLVAQIYDSVAHRTNVLNDLYLNNPVTETGSILRLFNDGHALDSTVRFNCTFNGVTLGTDGRVIVVGSYLSRVTIYGTPLTSAHSGAANSGYIARVDPSGNTAVWNHAVDATGLDGGGNPGACIFWVVAVDSSNNVYAAGTFTGTINLGGSNLTATSRTVFLVKYDANGNHLFSRQFVGGSSNPVAISVVSGKVYLSGGYLSTDLGGGLRTSSVTSGFVAQYNAADLSYVWDQAFSGGTQLNFCAGMSVDGSGNVYVSGYVGNTSLNLGGGALPYPGGLNAGFFAGYNSAGAHLWSRVFGSPGATNGGCQGAGMLYSVPSGLWLYGLAGPTEVFSIDSVLINCPASHGTFAVQINPATGAAIQGFQFGGQSSQGPSDYASALCGAVDSAGYLIFGGVSDGEITPDFGDSQPISGQNIFIAKYHPAHGLVMWYSTVQPGLHGGGGSIVITGIGVSPVDRTFFATGHIEGGVTWQGNTITSISINAQDAFTVRFTV
jgi:hypothetical protein